MSPEQRAYWVPLAERFEITGCYAQTELGHGSNLRGIETRATFDPSTDEFVLESPSISSSKIWIGALGCWSTHAIVVAKLFIKGKDYGNHLFLVQIRDLGTHAILPDIEILDQGEKALGAVPGVDNGIMRFFGKRIPRSQMFAGASSVSRDGTYHPAKNRNHSYTSMIIIRGMLSDELGVDMAKALYIAAKYVQFRRQFGADSPGEDETRVIEYASVKHRLFPAIARVSNNVPKNTAPLGLYVMLTKPTGRCNDAERARGR
jgi:acyl-CoA oxidase